MHVSLKQVDRRPSTWFRWRVKRRGWRVLRSPGLTGRKFPLIGDHVPHGQVQLPVYLLPSAADEPRN